MRQAGVAGRAARPRCGNRLTIAFLACLALVLLAAPAAHAELAFFANGRSMSIKGHVVEGDSLILTLRNGGTMVVTSGMIASFAPDEVPYPEPEPPPPDPIAPGVAEGPARYGALIDKYAREQGVDAKLVRAMIQVESGYRERARSRKGAMGLMQLMPATAQQYAVADPYDPESNIEAGIKHLRGLLQRLPVELALAAYNAGEATVQKFRGLPPYPETRTYVSRILELVAR